MRHKGQLFDSGAHPFAVLLATSGLAFNAADGRDGYTGMASSIDRWGRLRVSWMKRLQPLYSEL
jgi:hypothetical protein